MAKDQTGIVGSYFSGVKLAVGFLGRLLYRMLGLMLIGVVFWIAHSTGATGSTDAMGGLIVGICVTAWVAGWKKMR